MNKEMSKESITEQIKEPWDDSKVYDYVNNKKKISGEIVSQTEDAAKFDLLRMNAYLFTKGELEELYGVIGQIREARLDATIGKISKGSSK